MLCIASQKAITRSSSLFTVVCGLQLSMVYKTLCFLTASESSIAVSTDQESVSANNYAGLGTSLDSFDGAVAVIEQKHNANFSMKASTHVGGSQPMFLGHDCASFGETRGIQQHEVYSFREDSVKPTVQNGLAPINNSNTTSLGNTNARNLAK